MDDVKVLKKIKELDWDELRIVKGVFKGAMKVYDSESGEKVAVIFSNLFAFIQEEATPEDVKKEFIDKPNNIRDVEDDMYEDVVIVASIDEEDGEYGVDDEYLSELGIGDMFILDDIKERLELIYSAGDWSVKLMGM